MFGPPGGCGRVGGFWEVMWGRWCTRGAVLVGTGKGTMVGAGSEVVCSQKSSRVAAQRVAY